MVIFHSYVKLPEGRSKMIKISFALQYLTLSCEANFQVPSQCQSPGATLSVDGFFEASAKPGGSWPNWSMMQGGYSDFKILWMGVQFLLLHGWKMLKTSFVGWTSLGTYLPQPCDIESGNLHCQMDLLCCLHIYLLQAQEKLHTWKPHMYARQGTKMETQSDMIVFTVPGCQVQVPCKESIKAAILPQMQRTFPCQKQRHFDRILNFLKNLWDTADFREMNRWPAAFCSIHGPSNLSCGDHSINWPRFRSFKFFASLRAVYRSPCVNWATHAEKLVLQRVWMFDLESL